MKQQTNIVFHSKFVIPEYRKKSTLLSLTFPSLLFTLLLKLFEQLQFFKVALLLAAIAPVPFKPGQPVIQRRHRELFVVPVLCAKDSPEGPGEGGDQEGDQQDPRALETVMKLHNAMKNKNAVELSKTIADECQLFGNLSSIIKPLRGKKQVLAFFLNLIRHLGNDIEFIVWPTLHDGMNVGVQWGLEWKKTHTPVGKLFSFHIYHRYKGKVIIKNVEMFMEPLLHIPFRMKMMGIMTAIVEKMGSIAIFKGGANKVVLSILLVFITAAFITTLMLISL